MRNEGEFVNLSNMDFDISDGQATLLERVDKACKEIRPIEDKCYLEDRVNDQIVPIFAKAGLLGLVVPRKYGDGQGVDAVTYALAAERVGREGLGPAAFFSVHTALCQMTLVRWGNEEQKQRILTPATKGLSVLAFGLTEPNAGSDPASLTTSFEEKEGKFILSGQKTWISLGSMAKRVLIFAYPRGKKDGMCAFLVDTKSPGFKAERIKDKLGLRTSDTSTLYLDRVEVPREDLLGPPGKGLPVALSGLMDGRLGVAAGCVGVVHDCLDESLRCVGTRSENGELVGENQSIQRHVGLMSTSLEAAKLLTLRAAYMKQRYEEHGEDKEHREAVDMATTKAKYFASNAAIEAADRGMQVLNAAGSSIENRCARHFADARVSIIFEGTNEILEQKIALGSLGKDFEAYS